ncbi:MAG: hypothetical protein EOO74_06085, partial [Myxococcales bacterium]
MARWADVRAGTRARRRVFLPLGATAAPMPKVAPDGTVEMPPPDPDAIPLDLRILAPGETADVLKRARADAVDAGVPDPKDGNPIYDLAEMEHTLLLACTDVDSPLDAPRPFFDSIEQIRSEPRLDRERIAYLHAMQQRWQAECSPHLRNASAEETQGALLALGVLPEDESMRFFDSLGPGLQWTYTRILALRHVTSLTPRSPTSSPSEARPTASSTPSSPAAELAPS